MFRTKALGFAILTACEVAGRDGGAGAGEIAEKYDLAPPAYAGNMMTQLTKARVLQCIRGSIGGYTLEHSQSKRSVYPQCV